MRKSLLTAKTVEAAKTDPARRKEIADGIVPGLYLVVQRSGKKTWAVRTRIAGKSAKITLGLVSTYFGLAEARTAARAKLEVVQAGDDPRVAKRASISLPRTVGELCDLYISQRLKTHVRRWKAAEGEINNHIRPRLGALRLRQIDRGHIRQMLSEIGAEFPVAANRALARIRAVFNWAIQNDLALTNPTLGIKRPTKERPVSRTLSDAELALVWCACDLLSYPAKELVRLLILTGQRRDDVRCIQWGEIDTAMRHWVIPAERYKGGRSHLVPLTGAMVEILDASPCKKPDSFVFSSSNGEAPYSNVIKPKQVLDAESSVVDWTLHDIRRTVRTGLSRLGIRPDIAERVIGHSVGGRLGETYDVYTYRDEKLHALEVWGKHVAATVATKMVSPSIAKL